jgi:hypothetical protein
MYDVYHCMVWRCIRRRDTDSGIRRELNQLINFNKTSPAVPVQQDPGVLTNFICVLTKNAAVKETEIFMS